MRMNQVRSEENLISVDGANLISVDGFDKVVNEEEEVKESGCGLGVP